MLPGAEAATFVVTTVYTTADTDSLNGAITAANAAGGASTITFDASILPGTIALYAALPDIACDLTISGPGADKLTVSEQGSSRIFRVTTGRTVNILGLTLTNCTLAKNSSNGNFGGAILQTSGTLTMLNCTIALNAGGQGAGGGVSIQASSATMGNCIVAGNTSGYDLVGTVTSLGYNIIGNDTGTTFTGDNTGNQLNVSAGLDPDGLAYNGGTTQTIGLIAGSLAIDAGKALGSATTDQRGQARPFENAAVTNATGGDGSDIGAVEIQAAAEISVQQPAGTDLQDGVANVAFGTQEVGSATDVVFTIKNKGSLALALNGAPRVAVSGTDATNFTVLAQPAATLAASASATFTVRYVPSSTGAKTAALAISSDDADEGIYNIALTGGAQDGITLTSPATNGAIFPQATVIYTLPEAALSGSVLLSFNNGQFDFAVESSAETLGSNTVHLDTAGAGMPLGVYTLTLSYQDALGHTAASAVSQNVNLRPTAPVTTTILAQGAAAPGAGTGGLPADAVLASFNLPATSDDSDLAYVAKWTGAPKTKGTGLFLNDKCLALLGSSVPGLTGATFASFTDPVVDGGSIVANAGLKGSPKPPATVVVSNTSGTGTLDVIARGGDIAPDASGALPMGGATFKSFKAVAIHGGSIGIFAQLKATGASDIGLWPKDGTSPLKLALCEGQTIGTMTVGIGGVTKADSRGIFLSDGTGSYTPLARLGKPSGILGANFATLKDPVLSDDNAIAFTAILKGGTAKGLATKTICWQPAGGTLTLLAQGGTRPGADLPADAQWKDFTSLAIAGGGRGPIFAATLVPGKGTVTAKTATGVWACDFTGAPRALFRTGDTIGTKVLKSFTLLKATVGNLSITRSFNDAAEVVWLATFTDKTTAIIRTEVP